MNAIALSISNTLIRQDNQGRFCLNDLHKAAGGESRHQPGKWLEIQQTQELIAEIEKDETGIPVSKSAIEIIRGKGKTQGTYAVKELVYAYAMWISAKFHIAVIRAYDALVTGRPIGKSEQLLHATKEQREPLINAVRRLVKVAEAKGKTITYDQAHNIINLKMGVSSISEMTREQIPQAMTLVGELLERVVLASEYLAKPDATEQIPAPLHTLQYVPLDQVTSRFDVFFKNDPYWSKLPKMSMFIITGVAWNALRGTLNDNDLYFLNSAMNHLTIPRPHPLDLLANQIAESLGK